MAENLRSALRLLEMLNENGITIPRTFVEEAAALKAKVDSFCEANRSLLQERSEERKRKKEMQDSELTLRTIVVDLWLVFFFGLLREIEEEHYHMTKEWQYREDNIELWILKIDAQTKLFEVLQLIRKEWPHPMPPYGLVEISEGKLTVNAVLSRRACGKFDVEEEQPVYGFRTPPRLTSLESPSLEDYLSERGKVFLEPRWTQNEKMSELYCLDDYFPEDFDVLYQEHISCRTFLELEQLFPWFRFSFDPETSFYGYSWQRAGFYKDHNYKSGYHPASLIDDELFYSGLDE
jgi:hypothetical protein